MPSIFLLQETNTNGVKKQALPYSSLIFNDDENLTTYNGNHLPHLNISSAFYHVCFRLADSVPLEKQKQWQNELINFHERIKERNCPLSSIEIKRIKYLLSRKIDNYLDAGNGSCILKESWIAEIVKKSLEYYNAAKYTLHAWCIMPNHVHAILHMLENNRLQDILQGWKSYTAHCINKLLDRQGALWQPDYYNHVIRSGEEYCYQINYVWKNPEAANLKNWPWRWSCLHTTNI